MHVLNKEYYTAWAALSDPRVKFWIRVWQDGLHSAAHPEWSFCPLTLRALGRLWQLFVPKVGEPDRSRAQRHAIRVLASRRTGYPDHLRFGCPVGHIDHEWNDYWSRVQADQGFRDYLFTNALETINADGATPAEMSKWAEALAAELQLEGYSAYELFIRTGGVFDPRGKHPLAPSERLAGFIGHLRSRPTYRYVVSTEILKRATPLSVSMARRLAPLQLRTADEWTSGTGFVRTHGKAVAISCLTTSHSVTAFLEHRATAWRELRGRTVRLVMPGLSLAPESDVQQLEARGRSHWRHFLPRATVAQYLDRPGAVVEAASFAEALERIEDDPEESIRLLSDALERRFGTHWPKAVGHHYRKGLRRTLARRLIIAVQETRDRWGVEPERPTWLAHAETRINLAEVVSTIRDSGIHADELLAQRCADVLMTTTQYRTFSSVTGWLYLAKGIRNRIVHAQPLPEELRGTAAFLARVMLYSFVMSCPPSPAEEETTNTA